MLRCSTCREHLPEESFSVNKSVTRGRSYKCRSCTATYKKAEYDRDPEKGREAQRVRRSDPALAEYDRVRRRLKRYGLSVDELQAMREAQGGLCSICSIVLVPGKSGEHVDHDHATGQVRSLLCGSCNVMLGCAGDDPDRLVAGAAYLIRFSTHEHGRV